MTRENAKAYIFLDTNIYLEFQDFDQIDWPTELGYKQVCLVLAPIIITELESFKYDQRSERRQARSRKITKKLDRIIFSGEANEECIVPNRPNVTLLALTRSPDMASYVDLRGDIADDQLIASVLQFADTNPDIERRHILLVADDAGCLNKARTKRITVRRLEEQFRLPLEPSAIQKEVNNLKRQLQELQAQQPNLSLVVVTDDGPTQESSTSIVLLLEPDVSLYDKLYEDEVKATFWEPPKPNTDDNINELTPSFRESILAASRESVPQEEFDRYLRERENYLASFNTYLRDIYAWEARRSRSCIITFAIINDGTVPANGVVIRVVIPTEITVHTENFPKQPKQPKRPSLPRTSHRLYLDSLNGLMDNIRLSDYHFPSAYDSHTYDVDPDTLGPTITPYNSVLLEWERSKIRHHIPLELPDLALEFNNTEIREYELTYEIIAENIPMPVRGQIRLQVVPQEQPFDIAPIITKSKGH